MANQRRQNRQSPRSSQQRETGTTKAQQEESDQEQTLQERVPGVEAETTTVVPDQPPVYDHGVEVRHTQEGAVGPGEAKSIEDQKGQEANNEKVAVPPGIEELGEAHQEHVRHSAKADEKAAKQQQRGNPDLKAETSVRGHTQKPEGRILKNDEAVTFDADDDESNLVRVKEDVYREVQVRNSKRKTYRLVVRAGALVPKATLKRLK